MKTRFLKILALLLVLSCLFGCTPAQSPETQPPTEATVPPVEETEPPVEETRPPVALHYDYPEWNFSLTLPEQWAGKFSLVEDEIGVTFQLGDTSILSFVTVKNEPGAKELNDRLLAEDYTFHHDNGSQALFYKELSDIPMEYQIYQRGLKKPILHTEDILEEFWGYNEYASQVFNVFTNTADSERDSDWHYYLMKTPHYVSHRLGIDFTLPEELMKRGDIAVQFRENGMAVIFLYDKIYGGLGNETWHYEMYSMDYVLLEDYGEYKDRYNYNYDRATLTYTFENEVYIAEHSWFDMPFVYGPYIPVFPYVDDSPSFEQVMDAIINIKIITEEQPEAVSASPALEYMLYENGMEWEDILSRLSQ